MDITKLRRDAEAHLEMYVGLDKKASEALVGAVCDAVQAEVLNMVSGGEPYPSSMSELRVLRLRYMCEAAARRLTTQEVSVLFRTTDGAAETLLTRMQATYPSAVAKYLDALVRDTGHAEEDGSSGAFRYLVRFDELAAWEHAISQLRRVGCPDIRDVKIGRKINPPREFDEGGTKQNVLDYLGIARPAKK